jgi:hypothetical protein
VVTGVGLDLLRRAAGDDAAKIEDHQLYLATRILQLNEGS